MLLWDTFVAYSGLAVVQIYLTNFLFDSMYMYMHTVGYWQLRIYQIMPCINVGLYS